MFPQLDPFGPEASPVVLAVAAGVAWLYLRGLRRPRLAGGQPGLLRPLLFAAGVLALVLSLDAPLSPPAQKLFLVHQVQHLLVRLLGPLLIVLSRPWPVLAAGLPRTWRKLLGRMGTRPAVARARALFLRLPVAFALLVASLYLWQVPALHEAALATPPLALLAHGAMVAAGLLFFALILDPRDPPEGAPHPFRALALIGVILSNILLGSLTTLKETVLYTGYGTGERLWGFAPLADETIGGYTIWVPSSILILLTLLILTNGWNAAESRHWAARHGWRGSNSAALEYPETAEELWLKVKDTNRRTGRTMAAISLTVFAFVVITVTVLVYAL